jgi:hypothetical protein
LVCAVDVFNEQSPNKIEPLSPGELKTVLP